MGNSDRHPFGVATLPTVSVTFLLLPSTWHSKTTSRKCFQSTTRIRNLANLRQLKSRLGLLQEDSRTLWCTLSFMCVLCSELTLEKTIQSNGVLSLYNGIGPSTIGFVVYRGAQFGIQDILKSFNPYQKDFSAIGLASKFLVAQIAVSASGIVSYPLDTLQRRLKIEASKPKEQQMYNGMVDCFGKILKNEGPGGFFKGALANVLRGTGAALVLVIYDEIINAVS